MCGPMVVATLEDRKTQTRRLMNPQPELIYGLTDDSLSVIHNAHENKKWSEVEDNTSIPEFRLHGGRGWQDLFEDQICGLWSEGLRGLVSISRTLGNKRRFSCVHVPQKQEGDKIGCSVGLYGIPRNADEGSTTSAPPERHKDGEQTDQSEMGKPNRAMAGCTRSWYFSRRRPPLGLEVIQRGKAVFALGHTEGPLFPASCRTHSSNFAKLRLCDTPWETGWKVWVKETFCPQVNAFGQEADRPPFYRATDGNGLPTCHKWKPSIFMPRKASRVTLEILSVRVERLQDISEEDAKSEGCETEDFTAPYGFRLGYKKLWESINGKGSWARNDYVWAITFKRIPQPTQPSERE